MRDRLIVLATYAAALGAALWAGSRCGFEHPLAVALWADLVATLVVFAASLATGNSSLYDPYWSVAPLPLALYWTGQPEFVGVNPIRIVVVVPLVTLWGARLTWNWLRGWHGLGHEDWRYRDIAARTGRLYWPASFTGIHLFPTLIVFAGCLPLYVVMAAGREPFGPLDLVAACVTVGAIWIEARADKQLLRYRAGAPAPEDFLQEGLWGRSRHPNYFGEMGFWWGLWLFALAADPGWWWTGAGALLITLMFRFVSLPMIEERMRERRPAYSAWAERSALVVPRLRRSR